MSVDVQTHGYAGSFSLCVDTTPTYDYISGAIDIDTLKGTSSSDAEYTTVGASADGSAGTYWNNSGPLMNRWFKFTAPSTGEVKLNVDIDGVKGDQGRTQSAIWESDASTEVASNRYNNESDDLSVSAENLTPGNTYYLSVDVQRTDRAGSFTLDFDTVTDYSFYSKAILIDTLLGTCSSDAEYSTIGANGDLNAGSSWNNSGPVLNRWFKFTAPVSQAATITVDINGAKGDQERTEMAIWESNASTQVASSRYKDDNEDVSANAQGLTPGNTYYLSVDVQAISRIGTFTLDFDTVTDYSFYSKAIDIDTLLGTCSPDAEYSTVGANADLNAGTAWNNSGPLYNRWFKFTALTTDVTVRVDVDGAGENQQRTQLALWEDDSTTELESARYAGNDDNVSVTSTALTVGETYYISVDVQSSTRRGNFLLFIIGVGGAHEVNDVNGNWDSTTTWSTGVVPGSGDIVYIEDAIIYVDQNDTIAGINFNDATDSTGVVIENGGRLVVLGTVRDTSSSNFYGGITVESGGTLEVSSDMTFLRLGGNEAFELNIESGGTLIIGNDLIFISAGGSINNTAFDIAGSATIKKKRG